MLKTPDQVSPDDKRAALERVLRSQTLARSETLRKLLSYVCAMEIDGRSAEISEYSIAVDGLGRPKVYSVSEDSSVRNRVFALRKKLDDLYRVELAGETIRIELTKGSYCPHFVRLAEEQTLELATLAAAQPAPVPIPAEVPRRPLWQVFGAGFAVAALLGAWGWAVFGVSRIDPVLREAWGPLMGANANVAVVLSAAPALAIRGYEKTPPAFDGVPVTEAPSYLYPWYSNRHSVPPGQKLFLVPTQSSPSMGAALGGASLAGFLTRSGTSFEVLPEALIPMGATRNRNLILIGAPENSETMRRLLANTAFEIVFDQASGDYSVVDRENPGRKFKSVRDAAGRLTEVFGLVTVLSSEGSDGQRRTILITGTYSAAMAAAVDFLCSATKMGEFRSLLEREGNGGFPTAYQLVVKANTDHTLPISSQYTTHWKLK